MYAHICVCDYGSNVIIFIYSQSEQPLLYHKPVIRPLLSLLGSCMDTTLPEIENHVILLLHQLCVCISRNPQVRSHWYLSKAGLDQNVLYACLILTFLAVHFVSRLISGKGENVWWHTKGLQPWPIHLPNFILIMWLFSGNIGKGHYIPCGQHWLNKLWFVC